MSELVCSRLCHIRDQIRIDTEQILYFSRLGAEHKDYLFPRATSQADMLACPFGDCRGGLDLKPWI